MSARHREAALDRVFELAARLGDGMDRYLSERGLTPARAEILMALHQRGALVQRELSQTLRCSPRHVTGLVDTLEAAGMVRREPHPTDRRAVLVALTSNGVKAAGHMASQRQGAAQAMFRDITDADLATFIAVADHALEVIRQTDPTAGTESDARWGSRQ